MQKKEKPFEIGLIMAGAVSAGAYTAGVIDYLIEALDMWHKQKDVDPKTPSHNIKIRVMTGASAGGMTTAIAIAELLTRPDFPGGIVPSDYKSLLYKAWVDEIDISALLETNDLKKHKAIKSLLDSTIIENIAKKVINADAPPAWKKIPYIDERLRIYLTLSNLRGLPYEFKLNGETGFPYGMTDHSDYQYVEIKEDTKSADWLKLRNAAIATGAFPVGLAPRLIERDLEEYKTRIHKDGRDISSLLKIDTAVNKPYNFVAVDGGTLNNEPIELARSLWLKVTEEEKQQLNSMKEVDSKMEEKKQKAEAADCPYALVLVDPFPDLIDEGENATGEDASLSNIIAPLIQAIRAQSLFKIEELLRAGDKEDDNCFLIAPIRYTKQDTLANNAIASGFFGGFGGFLSHAFRKHDYYLGRRNCQQFLRKYFILPKEKALKYGWDVHGDYEIKKTVNDVTETFYPIIPIIKKTTVDEPQGEHNDWPVYTENESDNLKRGLSFRIGGLLEKTLPFGWISSTWVTVLMIMDILFVFAGEYVKASRSGCNCDVFFEGLKNSYILLFQVILLAIFLILMVLRTCKVSIQKKLVNAAHNAFLSQLKKWGITIG